MGSEGKMWHDTRKFSLAKLTSFGFGKKSMDGIILTEVKELIEKLKGTKGAPVSTKHRFNATAVNVLWAIVAGERYSLEDPKLKELITLLQE